MKQLLTIIISMLLVNPAWAADEWLKLRPISTDQRVNYPADAQKNNAALERLLAQYPKGILLTYSSATTIVASTGGVVCSNADGSIRKMRENTSTTNITFSDLDTGSEAASTTYYVYAVADADATTATFKISASSTAPTGVTYYKRIGSFYNNSSSNIEQVSNDNSSILVAQGTVAHGGTIALPTGYAEDQCKWIASEGTHSSLFGISNPDGVQYFVTLSGRTVSAYVQSINSGAVQAYITSNYLIVCNK